MFAGITRREVRLTVFAALIFIGGIGVGRWAIRPAAPPTRIQGPAAPVNRSLKSAPPPAEEPAAITGQIDLNKASAKDLESLPGIGPARAADIVALREQRGGFRAVNDLLDVPGIGDKSLARLRDFVRIDEAAIPAAAATPAPVPQVTPLPVQRAAATPAVPETVSINFGTPKELELLEGVGPKLADRIVADRITNGPFRSIEDIVRVKGIGPSILEKNRQRIRLD